MKLKAYFRIFAFLCLFIVCPSIVLAGKGIVVYKDYDCDYFLVKTSSGYAILEWYGGSEPEVGDILIGNIDSYGFKNIYNKSRGSKLRVYVEEYWIWSLDEALEGYYELCE